MAHILRFPSVEHQGRRAVLRCTQGHRTSRRGRFTTMPTSAQERAGSRRPPLRVVRTGVSGERQAQATSPRARRGWRAPSWVVRNHGGTREVAELNHITFKRICRNCRRFRAPVNRTWLQSARLYALALAFSGRIAGERLWWGGSVAEPTQRLRQLGAPLVDASAADVAHEWSPAKLPTFARFCATAMLPAENRRADPESGGEPRGDMARAEKRSLNRSLGREG